jgi:hypothetical protein
MYIPNSEMELSDLRQGDIIKDIQLFGAIHYGSVHLITNPNRENVAWQSNTKPTIGYAIVLSHSCEIARENGVKLTSIVLAPLRDIETASRPEKISELIASNDIREDSETSYLKYFYLEPNELIPFSKGAIVDFSKTFSVKKDSYDYILSKKLLQINDYTQSSLARKYALFYYRTTAA